MVMQDRTAPGGRTPVSPAGGRRPSDSGQLKMLHDAMTLYRHGVMVLDSQPSPISAIHRSPARLAASTLG